MTKRNTLILILAAGLASSACNYESFDERCIREAREFTEQQCPRRLDPCTILDSLTYDTQSRTLAYHYTVEGILDSAGVYTDDVISGFTKEVKNEVANSVQLRRYKQEKLNFDYVYISKSRGEECLRIKLTPKDYQEE